MSSESQEFNTHDLELERQHLWEVDGVHTVVENPNKAKLFIVDMFPYPSGAGIHVGHVKNYVATDVQARAKYRQGYSVLHPMGYDSFGLPAENYALSQGVHPRDSVNKNVDRFGQQLRRLGLGYDWDRQINTIDDDFIKWTQDGFLTLYEKGLVSEEEAPINWCNSCETGLSNEDLEEDGSCERCGSDVERKLMRQWIVHITDYADDLLKGMDDLTEWEPFLLDIQRNWIGKQEGWRVKTDLKTNDNSKQVGVFVTDPSVLNGATYLAISPEKAKALELSELLTDEREKEQLSDYVTSSVYKSDRDRKFKGIDLKSVSAVNPFSGEAIPIIVSEAVLPSSDDGMFYGNPRNNRDYELGVVFDLFMDNQSPDESKMDSSGQVLETLIDKNIAVPEKIYRLEDWVFSRQRFWGEPIPLIHCTDCGVVPVPRNQLPVLLPDVESYSSTETGESPLANIDSWVNTSCPDCDGPAKRETNTMPQWAGSSWYWHRYKDPHNDQQLVSSERDEYWRQVDIYVGGAEHAARHLIYARFWNFVLQEAGVVIDREPFKKVQHIGLVMDENGVKISKRLGNGVDIDTVVEEYGADALRLGVMQMGEFAQQTNWNTNEIASAKRFLDKVWKLQYKVDWQSGVIDTQSVAAVNAAIEKVTDDIDKFKFNTATAAIRTLVNHLERKPAVITAAEYEVVLSLLQPFAPHITEKILTKRTDFEGYYMQKSWPEAMVTEILIDENREIVVMKNGKKIGVFAVNSALQDPDEILALLRVESDTINQLIEEGVKRIVAPPGKNIVNLVIEP